jgi:cation transport ATPase
VNGPAAVLAILDIITPTPPVASRAVNLGVWVVLVALLVVWQVRTATTPSLPSFGALVRLARRHWISRWVLLLAWVWLGWHVFVRGAWG